MLNLFSFVPHMDTHRVAPACPSHQAAPPSGSVFLLPPLRLSLIPSSTMPDVAQTHGGPADAPCGSSKIKMEVLYGERHRGQRETGLRSEHLGVAWERMCDLQAISSATTHRDTAVFTGKAQVRMSS